MKQILIVEDDELLNKMLVYNLQSESYGIVSVETVKEAMEVLKSQPFDLVLLDINLPDGNGYEIAKTIQDKYSDSSILLMLAIGLPITLLVWRKFSISSYAGRIFPYEFPWLQMGVYVVVLVTVEFILSVWTIRRQKKQSLIEQMRAME